MFNCQKCKRPSRPHEKMTKVVVDGRPENMIVVVEVGRL